MVGLLFKMIVGFLELFFNLPPGIVDAAENGAMTALCRWISISVYNASIGIWNAITGSAVLAAVTDPDSIVPGAYQMANGFNATLALSAGNILCILFLYRMIRDDLTMRDGISLRDIVKDMMVFIFTESLVVSAPYLLTSILEIGSAFCTFFSGIGALQTDAEIMDILTNGKPGLPTAVFMMICSVSIIVTGITILITVAERIIKLLCHIPFANIFLATTVAGGQAANIGYSWLKSFTAFVLEGVLIILILNLGNMLISGGFIKNLLAGVIFDEDSWGFWRIVVCGLAQIVGCGAISGCIKSVDHLVHRMTGF